jgi:Mrp family chromosome partitioning ATPase/capsular polysaccharide biosynthesis protein
VDVVDYLRILRRRWKIILAATLIGVVVGLVTLPPAPRRIVTSSGTTTTAASSYEAITTLLQTHNSSTVVPLDSLPTMVTSAGVAQRVAKALDYQGDPTALIIGVLPSADAKASTLAIKVTNSDPERAVALSTAFADSLIAELRDQAQKSIETKVGMLEKTLTDYQARRSAITGSSTLEQLQRQALDDAYSAIQNQVVQLQVDSATAGFDLQVLQQGTASAVTSSTAGSSASSASSSPTSNRWLRFAVIVLMSALLGAALALAIERFDTRLRGRKAFEETLLLPVVASVPTLSRRARGRHEITSLRYPLGGVAEAYRSLRSALSLLPSRPITLDALNFFAPGSREVEAAPVMDPHVLLFTSPRAGDGKTTSLVNLATALVESGRRVIVLDCDFRNPEAHRFFEVPDGHGLSDLLADARGHSLASILQPTSVPGVVRALAGASTAPPGALLGQRGDLREVARARADVVLVDAPPLLLAYDAIDLMPFVDSVVVCVREGRTTNPEAQQTAALLGRLRVPCLGLVVVGAGDAGAAYFRRGDSMRHRLGRRPQNSEQAVGAASSGARAGGDRDR